MVVANEPIIVARTKDMPKEEWLKWRRKGIGGSDVGAIAGLNPWKTPLEVYLDKRGELPPEENQSEAAYWGTVLEDVVAKELKKRNEKWIQRKNFLLAHPKHQFMQANVDRIVFDKERGPGILEVKTTSAYLADDWKDGQIPDSYNLQANHYMAVTGYEYAWFAVLIGGQKYHQVMIERDEELIDIIIELESKFWEQVKRGEPPAVDGSAASSRLLKHLYPEDNGEIIDLPEQETLELIEQFKKGKELEKQGRDLKNEAQNKLKAMLGENVGGRIPGYQITSRTIQRDGYEVKPTKYRNFSIRKVGEKKLRKRKRKNVCCNDYHHGKIRRRWQYRTWLS